MKRSTRHLVAIEVACSEEVQSDVLSTIGTNDTLVDCSDEMADGVNDTAFHRQGDNPRPHRQVVIRQEQTRRTWTGY